MNSQNILTITAAVYLVAVNILSVILFGTDKRRARRGKWRISEKALLTAAIIGGSIGALIGMHAFHHKTRRGIFRYGVPVILILQILLVRALFNVPFGTSSAAPPSSYTVPPSGGSGCDVPRYRI